MQFQPVTKSVELIGVTEQRQMTIANTGKVFYTFISGLYSRKIESICREITSNARDGHVKRGNADRPYFVHCPTRWEPWFSVRDFGCGIDHETVIERCSVIGWSSKETNNEEIGTFGYGMKSPFAKTSQYTLTCWDGMEKRIYSYHLDETGTPNIVLRDRSPCDEEQGVEIRFDVKSHDIYAFEQAIRWVGLPYAPCFESNLSNVRSADIFKDEGTFFHTGDTRNGPMVAVGPVWYEIDFDQLPDCASIRQFFENDQTLVLRSDIGDLGIVPSREALEYTPKTVANLTRLLHAAHAKIKTQVNNLLATCTSVWDAAKKLHEIKGGIFTAMARAESTPWGLFGNVGDYTFNMNTLNDVQMLVRDGGRVMSKKCSRFDRGGDLAIYLFDQRKGMPTAWRRRVLADMKAKGIFKAIYAYLPDPKVAVLTAKAALPKEASRSDRKSRLHSTFKITEQRRKSLERQIKEFGCPVIVTSDNLPEPEKIVYDRDALRNIVMYLPARHGAWDVTHSVTPVEDKLNLVFELTEKSFRASFRVTELREMVKKAVDMEVGVVVGVSTSNFKKFLRAHPGFEDYRELFNEKFFNVAELEDRRRQLAAVATASVADLADRAKRTTRMMAMLTKAPRPVAEFLSEADTAVARIGDMQRRRTEMLKDGLSDGECCTLLSILGKQPEQHPEPVVVDRAEAAYERLAETYPRIVGSFLDAEEAAIYVLGLDALRSQQAVSFMDETLAA